SMTFTIAIVETSPLGQQSSNHVVKPFCSLAVAPSFPASAGVLACLLLAEVDVEALEGFQAGNHAGPRRLSSCIDGPPGDLAYGRVKLERWVRLITERGLPGADLPAKPAFRSPPRDGFWLAQRGYIARKSRRIEANCG